MKSHLKTALFFFLLIGAVFGSHYIKNHPDFDAEFENFYLQSENAREIYTGKIRPVYDQIDEAWKVTNKLKGMIPRTEDYGRFQYTPVISMWIDPDDLHSKDRGLNANARKKGRLWERAAYLRYYEKGQLKFQSYVGVRMHGGATRLHIKNKKSFRIYLRKKYGEKEFVTNFPYFSNSEKVQLKKFVIRRPGRVIFNNLLSHYLIEKLGGRAPKLKPVAFFINGKFENLSNLSQHLSIEGLFPEAKEEDYLIAKLKGDLPVETELVYENLRERMEQEPNLTLARAEEYLNVDSIIASVLTIMFGGTTDWAQGAYIKKRGAKERWTLWSWDFDRAFEPVLGENTDDLSLPRHQIDSTELVTEIKVGKIRHSVFNRLISSDIKFRQRFSKKTDQLAFLIQNRKMKEIIQELELTFGDFKGIELQSSSFEDLNLFLTNRMSYFCKDLQTNFALKPKSCL
ncbi:MAG: hypothetical protein CME62_08675 [Halobacteriovoraceae bacterium]|nr:hypothetical protein [Halobacteriovoraceae bacterium]|tara:strand:+ start:25888 stop:27255 length:1368 start_codon:yes stop_codon:yes gene_type:complete